MSDLDDFRRAKDAWIGSDPRSPLTPAQREGFAGLAYYDAAPDLAFVLVPEVCDPITVVELPTSAGETAMYERWARVRFEVDGHEVTLTIFREPSTGALFLPFLDAGAGDETYGGGRYLEVHAVDDDRLLVDFNYAYNPYCAYNEGYSCPVPPAENRLPVRIRAGERNYQGEAVPHRH